MALTHFLNKEEEIVRLIPERLAEWINIEIKETETLWLFCSDGIIYSQYSEEAETVIKRNENYAQMCKNSSTNSDIHSDVEIQTSNPLTIDNEIQCDPVNVKEIGCWSTSWDLYDSITTFLSDKQAEKTSENSNNNILQKSNLIENLISLNIHQKVLVVFRNAINVTDSSLSLEHLWSLTSPITENKSVTSLVLNKADKDLLCAGYGHFNYDNRVTGLVCCWSLKNLLHPKCYINCPSSVLSVDFSNVQTNKLACGLSNGILMVFDVQSGQQLWDSKLAKLYHLGPIWAVRWIQVTESHNLLKPNFASEEKLLTLSEDGTVCHWTFGERFQIKKRTILRIKRDDVIKLDLFHESLTRCEPLWDFDFKETTLDSYLVSTGHGSIHKCSRNASETVEQTYFGHQGPVYKIHISPFMKTVFLTCGADWTIKLWDENSYQHQKPLLSFQTSMNPVYDISWSPHSSTVFVNVYPNRLDVWDLNVNLLEPVLSEKSGWKESFTSVMYSETSNALYVGTDVGKIHVYAIKGGHNHQGELLKSIVNHLDDNRKQPNK